MIEHPSKAGQAVRSIEGRIGITTTDPNNRTPAFIAVMFLGGRWDVRVRVDGLAVIEVAEVDHA